MLIPSSLFGDDDEAVRLTFGTEDVPRLLQRWSDDLSKYGLSSTD